VHATSKERLQFFLGTHKYLLVENLLASTLRIHLLYFQPIMPCYKMKNSTIGFSKTNLAITKNKKCTIIYAHTPVINLKVGVLLAVLLRFAPRIL